MTFPVVSLDKSRQLISSEQAMNKWATSGEQVMNRSWTSYEQLEQVKTTKAWATHGKAVKTGVYLSQYLSGREWMGGWVVLWMENNANWDWGWAWQNQEYKTTGLDRSNLKGTG